LAAVRAEQDSKGLGDVSFISEETQACLEDAASQMPELRFFHDLVRDWEAVVYLLTHLARGAFGVPMAEALFVRSAGRSGKDTLANLMCALLGSYSTSISCDSLCSIPSPDAPSPTFAGLRARRFVAIREVTEQKIQPSVYKRFCDPVSELSGRNLYDNPVHFRPQFLAFFCSNAPLSMTSMDAAVKARTAIIDFASIFTSNPTEANHAAWRDMSQEIIRYRPGVFWILQRLYHHLLRNRPMRNVAPVPQGSLDANGLDCREQFQERGDRFIAEKLSPAKGPSEASTAKELEDAVAGELGIERAGAGLWLQGRGFERVRSKASRTARHDFYYRFCFTIGGMKALMSQYVKLA
jgi:hypothetical protein